MRQRNKNHLLLLVTMAAGLCIASESRAATSQPSDKDVSAESSVTSHVEIQSKDKVKPVAPPSTEASTATPVKPDLKSEVKVVVHPQPAEVKATKSETKSHHADVKPETGDAKMTTAEPVKKTVEPESAVLAAPASAAPTSTGLAPATTTVTAPVPSNPKVENSAASTAASTTVDTNALTLNLAKQVSVAAFTYDYKNYQQQFDGMAKYFTPEGWVAFSDALKRSNNVDEVKKDQISVNAKVDGEAKIVKQDIIKGSTVFKIEVPLSVTYKGLTQNIQQNLLVEIVVVPVAPSISADGVAVTQFIAKTVTPSPAV